MEIKELQEKIYEFEKKHRDERDLEKQETQEEIKVIAEQLMKLLEDNFIFRAEKYYNDGVIEEISEVIGGETYEGKGFFWEEAYGLKVLTLNKKEFMKNLKKIFFLGFMDYQFENSKKIITLTHDGDLMVKENGN